MAMIIAAEMGAPLRVTSGPAIQHAGDLAAILSGLGEGDVLFLDEIHRMSRPAEEMLYLAMEDFRVDVVVGKGPGATAIPLEIPPFTLVGATTRAGLLPGPLRDRFGFTGAPGVLRAGRPAAHRDPLGAAARGARSTPTAAAEIAVALARHAADRQPAAAPGPRLRPGARRRRRRPRAGRTAALALFEVDELGLDRLDRAVLDALCRRFGGGPVGLRRSRSPSARSARPSRRSPSRSWCAQGYLARTPRGRVATPAAWAHLGLRRAAGAPRSPTRPSLFDDE